MCLIYHSYLAYQPNLFRFRCAALYVFLVVAWNDVGAQTPTASKAPVVYSNTVAVVAIDTAKIELPNSMTQSSHGSVAGFSRGVQSLVDRMQQLSDGHTAYAAVDIPYGTQQALARVVLHKGKHAADFWSKKNFGALRAESDGCLIVTFQENAGFRPGIDAPPSHAETLQLAESRVREFPIRCLIVPPEYFTTTLEQTLPNLPKTLGGLPTQVFTRGLRWAAIGFDPATFRLEGTIQSDSADAAKALEESLPTLLTNSINLLPKHQQSSLKPLARELIENMQMRVHQDQIQFSFPKINDRTGPQLLAASLESIADPAHSAATSDKLRAIQLAILNYESANACFPPSVKYRDKNGKSGLSWRVHILPYFGEVEAELWRQFHLDEPWDSEHNIKLLPKMPKVYQPPTSWLLVNKQEDQVLPTKTAFLAPQGKGTIFGQDEVVRIRDVKDGTSRTLTVVKVDPKRAKLWTAPDDYQFDADDPAAGLAFDATGIAYGVACDGSVHKLKKEWNAETFLRLFQCDDGQPVSFE